MKQKEFIESVREKSGKSNFHYWTVEHLIKAGVINPKQRGRGIPREFSEEDIRRAVEYYSTGK